VFAVALCVTANKSNFGKYGRAVSFKVSLAVCCCSGCCRCCLLLLLRLAVPIVPVALVRVESEPNWAQLPH